MIPGFVDTHTHLVFAGDRARGVRRADGRRAVRGRRHPGDDRRDARGGDRGRSPRSPPRGATRRGAAGITHVEIKSGYGLDVATELRSCEVAAELTDDVTFLGAHVGAARVRGPRRRLRRAGLRRDARRVRAARPLDRRVLRGRRVRRRPVARRARGGPRRRARAARPRQPARPGPRRRSSRSSSAPRRSTTAPTSTDADVAALAGGDTVATFLPATDFSTRQPYPDARRVIDAGATVAIATNCNPGSSYTTSMAFCIALAVRDMRMTIEEALLAATRGGARALRRDDVGHLAPGAPRRRRRCSTRPRTRTSSIGRACRWSRRR